MAADHNISPSGINNCLPHIGCRGRELVPDNTIVRLQDEPSRVIRSPRDESVRAEGNAADHGVGLVLNQRPGVERIGMGGDLCQQRPGGDAKNSHEFHRFHGINSRSI